METRALLFKTAEVMPSPGRPYRRSGGAAGDGVMLVTRPFAVNVKRPGIAVHYIARNDDLLDPVEAGQVEHRLEQDRLHDRAEAACAGLALDGALGDRGERIGVEVQLDVFHLEEPLVLLDQG